MSWESVPLQRIPHSYLSGSVTLEYVTIQSPGHRVMMLTKDAHHLMQWLYDTLPSPRRAPHAGSLEMAARQDSVTALRRLRRAA